MQQPHNYSQLVYFQRCSWTASGLPSRTTCPDPWGSRHTSQIFAISECKAKLVWAMPSGAKISKAKLGGSVCLPHPRKNSIFFFPPFGVLIFRHPQPTQKQLDRNRDNIYWQGLTMMEDRRPAYNMRLASYGVKCLNSNAVFQINFSAGLTVLCPEIPHERQAQNRQAVKKPL